MKPPALVARGGCALCASPRLREHIAFPEIPVLRCADCGFLQSGRVLDAAALAAYYAEGFGGLRHQRGQAVNARVNAALLPRLVPLQRGQRVLDVGAGYGYLLQRLQQRHGVVGVGVEPSRQEAAHARDALGLQVIPALLHEAGLAPGSFDLVASFEVIEHVADPRGFIRELLAHVKPGGRLVLMTDNFESTVVRALGAGFPKWIPHTHISHFSAATLARTLAEVPGLVLERALSYTPWEFGLRDLARRLGRANPEPAAVYRLDQALAAEMGGGYRLYALRRLLNPAWALATATPRLDGAVMYFACRKTA